MSTFTIDLCVAWARVAECVKGTFDGIVRDLAAGEWRLTGSIADIEFNAAFTINDIDTVRVVRDAAIVYAGYVTPAGSGAGGLQITESAAGEIFTLSGPDLWAVLASRLAYPTPSTGPPWANSHDIRTGVASTAAAGYILNNAGNLATANRQIPGLIVIDGAVGVSGSWSARLQPLDELVARVCRDGGITCRLVVDFDGLITIRLGSPTFRAVVLSDQGDLLNIDQLVIPASATYVIAGGQGDLTARTFATSGTATGAARREAFSDQSSLSTAAEVQQAAATALALAAETLSVRADITDTAAGNITYLEQYDVGDTISVDIGIVRYRAVVTAVQVHVGPERAVISPVLGDAAPNLVAGLLRDIAGLQSRFDNQIN